MELKQAGNEVADWRRDERDVELGRSMVDHCCMTCGGKLEQYCGRG